MVFIKEIITFAHKAVRRTTNARSLNENLHINILRSELRLITTEKETLEIKG